MQRPAFIGRPSILCLFLFVLESFGSPVRLEALPDMIPNPGWLMAAVTDSMKHVPTAFVPTVLKRPACSRIHSRLPRNVTLQTKNQNILCNKITILLYIKIPSLKILKRKYYPKVREHPISNVQGNLRPDLPGLLKMSLNDSRNHPSSSTVWNKPTEQNKFLMNIIISSK